MSQYLFGAGVVWGTPLTDYQGNAIANPSPVNLGALQDVSIDISFDTKLLYGSNQFPLDVARGKGKISGKAKFAKQNAMTINSLVFGQVLTRTGVADVFDTTGIAIPSTPFNITVSSGAGSSTNVQIPGSGAGVGMLGVRDNNNNPMVCVASGPTTGQYEVVSISAGTITLLFASADAGKTVFIDYQYTYTSSGSAADLPGYSIVTNALMGYAPQFQCDFFNAHSGKQLTLRLYCCVSSKWSIATKLDDYAEPEFDFDAFANSANQVLEWGTSE